MTEKNKYFEELIIGLRQNGFAARGKDNELLCITHEEQPLCQITNLGGVRYRKEDVATETAADALQKVTNIATTTAEYMTLMDNALPLKVGSLDAPYKLLAEFNGAVLGGMESKYGVQFTTWQWTHERTGLTFGHYCGNDYAAAKEDFTVRAGLVEKQKLFTPQQLTVLYSGLEELRNRTNEDITYERERELEQIQQQIIDIVPDLSDRLAIIENSAQPMQQTM